MAEKVALIIVNFNGLRDTRACLASLAQVTTPETLVCVVDNGSEADEAAVLRGETGVTTIRMPVNQGYAAACNAGVAWAKTVGAEYVCLLNNDTLIEPHAIAALMGTVVPSGGRGIYAPLILRPDGFVWSAGGKLRWPNVAGEHIGEGQPADAFSEAFRVTWASGCALLFPTSVFDEVGPLDERFFLYLEDIEWCLRAAKKGIATWVVPEARIRHGVSKSIQRSDPRITRYYAYRNFYLLGMTHGSAAWRAWLWAHLGFTLSKILVRNLTSGRHRRDALYNARSRGLTDFLRRRFGPAPYAHFLATQQPDGMGAPR